MENELNYPVKYAVLELKVKGDWKNDYKDRTIGFIASKCRIVSQNIRYFQDGTSKLSYQVVFPYKNIEEYKNRISRNLPFDEIEKLPNFGSYDNCLNATVVSEIYDTYDEASDVADNKNSDMRHFAGAFVYPTWQVKREEKIKEFDTNIAICKSFEHDIIEATSSMQVTSESISVKQFVKK